MPLATKNGSIIVKDGKLAENCDCCGGLCVCDATSVTVSISSGNFLRHMLLRNSSGAEARVSLAYIAAPSSGVHVLRKDTIVPPEVGISPSKWVSNNVPSPGNGRITAVVYRPTGNAPVRVTVGIPVFYWRSVGIRIGGTFKSLDEMIAESAGGKTALQGYGTLVVELVCDSQTGTSRIISYFPGDGFGGGWSPVGSQVPFTACDFKDVNGVLGFSDLWEGEALLRGTERLLSQGMSIVSDTGTGDNIVTLDGIDLTCCEDESDGACCEGTTCSVKPQCKCQGAGKVFKGVGTVCSPNPCGCCGNSETIAGKTATLYVSTESMPVLRWCPQVSGGTTFLQCPDGLQYGGCWAVKPCETPAIGAWVDTAFSASATFINNTPASSCSASLQGQCLADTRPASVFLSASPCKIYAIAECPGLVGVFVSGSSLMPYFAWDYDPLISEYNATYYVFQYTGGSGQSTATQSVNATPVPPPQAGFTWSLFKTVTLSMRLTLV